MMEKKRILFLSIQKETYLWKTNLDCGLINATSYEMIDSNNQINLLSLANSENLYSDIFQFTVYTGNYNIKSNPYFRNFEIFSLNVKSSYVIMEYPIRYSIFTFLPNYQVKLFHEFMITTKCGLNSYGRGCWYECEDNERLFCKCAFQENLNKINCSTSCHYGWLPKYIMYEVGGYKEMIMSCNTINICINFLSPINVECYAPFVCFPEANYTYYCELIYVALESTMYQENITSDVFAYGETIKVLIDKSQLIYKPIAINTTTFLNSSESVFKNKLIDIMYTIDGTIITVIGLSKMESIHNFSVLLNIQAWHYSVLRSKEFRIYKPPDAINLYRYNDSSVISVYVFIGEILEMNSTSLPVYRTINFWKCDVMTFSFGENLKIPLNSSIGSTRLKLTSMLIVPKRKPISFTKTFTIFLRAYEYFKWNKSTNILSMGDEVHCIVNSVVKYNLFINQLSGKDSIRIIADYIFITNVTGGLYQFVCHLITEFGAYFATYIEFELRNRIDKICLFFFPRIVGSLVQCGHNGYFKDEYESLILITAISNGEYNLLASGKEYVRIPYYFPGLKYEIKCLVQHLLNNSLKSMLQNTAELTMDYKTTYVTSDDNKLCLKYDDYIEYPIIHDYSNEVIEFEIFFILLIGAYPHFNVILIYAVIILKYKTFPATIINLKISVKKIKTRQLNEKLCAAALEIITRPKKSKVDVLSEKRSMLFLNIDLEKFENLPVD